jgi:hypothetical protein
MASESIISYKKLEHPSYRVSDKSVRTDIEYVGPFSTLNATLSGELKRGLTWGDYPGRVTDIDIKGIEGTDLGELTVGVELEVPSDGDFGFNGGVLVSVAYEIDWVVVGRPLIEHPNFSSSGSKRLTDEDLEKIATWEDEKTPENFSVLSDNAKYYATGIMKGISSYDDFAPVLSKTTTYVGGPGPTSSAGMKDNPAGFPNRPSGYEWIKSADRSLRSGTRDKWDRTEQWTGAHAVLVDKNGLYY